MTSRAFTFHDAKCAARVWVPGTSYREYRTPTLPESDARRLLDLLAREQGAQDSNREIELGRPTLSATRTADGGYVYVRFQGADDRGDRIRPRRVVVEAMALCTSGPEWLDDVAGCLDSLGHPTEAANGKNWIPVVDVKQPERLLARFWIERKGCGYYCHGNWTGEEADDVTRAIVMAERDYQTRDVKNAIILRMSNPETRLFLLTFENPDPNNPDRKVVEAISLLTADRNCWSRDVALRLRELVNRLPRDEELLRNEGWSPAQTAMHRAGAFSPRRFSFLSLLGLSNAAK